MMLQVLHCPHCHGTAIVRHGQTRQGQQRYRCREQRCAGRTFLLDSSYPGQSPAVKQQIVEMALNARGIRDTARVLHVRTNTVMTELQKRHLTSTRETTRYYRSCNPSMSPWRGAAPRNWSDGADAPQHWTQCGVTCVAKRTHAGGGTPWITTQGRSWRRCSDDGRTRSF